jgi:peptidoglycan/LPS O-acetylase OafA/YrhL
MVLWSLAVEEQFYLLYPWVLRWVGRTRNFVIFLAVLFTLGPVFRVWAAISHPENYWLEAISTFGVMDQLAVGCFLYVAWEHLHSYLERTVWPRWVLTVLGAVMIVLIFTCTNHYDRWDMIWAPTLVAVGGFLFLLGGLSIACFEFRGGWILTLPGKYSYGNYLLHTTVLFFMYSFLLSKPTVWAFPFYLVVSTVVAALSFHFYEYPLNVWIRRRFDPSHSQKG